MESGQEQGAQEKGEAASYLSLGEALGGYERTRICSVVSACKSSRDDAIILRLQLLMYLHASCERTKGWPGRYPSAKGIHSVAPAPNSTVDPRPQQL